MSVVLGVNCKAYYQTTGTRLAWPASGAAPNLTVLSNVTDVTINLEKGEADVTTRTNNGWKATEGTLKDGSVEFEMVWDTSDAGFTAIKNAYFNGTDIACAFLDGASDTAGSQGLWADFAVTNLSRSEPLNDAAKAKVTLKPAYTAVAPAWVTVSS